MLVGPGWPLGAPLTLLHQRPIASAVSLLLHRWGDLKQRHQPNDHVGIREDIRLY